MRNSLRKIEGVRDVDVDIDEKSARIVVVENVDSLSLIAATTNIGFPSEIRASDQ